MGEGKGEGSDKMTQIILEGLMLGISAGVYCLGSCLMFFMPYLLAEAKTKVTQNLKKIALFLLGRLIAYVSFAFLMGLLSQFFQGVVTPVFSNVSLILVSLLMLAYAFTRNFTEAKWCVNLTCRLKLTQIPFLLGFFSGLNPCLPFLAGVSRLWTLKSVFLGVILFIGFFAGTAVYTLPLVFVSYLNRLERIKRIGEIIVLLSGIWFLFVGITGLIR